MYNEATCLKCLSYYYTWLSKGFCSDLRCWNLFVRYWNGVSFLDCVMPPFPPDTQIEICRCIEMWLVSTRVVHRLEIVAKELVPIVLSCALWGSLLPNKILEFKCDNQGFVGACKEHLTQQQVCFLEAEQHNCYMTNCGLPVTKHQSQLHCFLQNVSTGPLQPPRDTSGTLLTQPGTTYSPYPHHH